MTKAKTSTTKSDRPSQRTLLPLEQRFNTYGDDSSDEEREEEVYNTPIKIRTHSGTTLTISKHKNIPLTPEHHEWVEKLQLL